MKVSGVILAAGLGTRMGEPKALRLFRGRPLLDHVADLLKNSIALEEIIVVTGAEGARVERRALELGLRTAHNEAYQGGLMSSLQAGLRAVGPQSEGALITLVDQPLIRPRTVRDVVLGSEPAHLPFRERLRRASYFGQPGHPCLIGRAHFETVWAQPNGDKGAAFLFKQLPHLSHELHVDDPGVVTDFDHPADMEPFDAP